MEKNKYLDEKILVLTYLKPRYSTEIMKYLYGKKINPKLYSRIKKLVKNGWLKPVEPPLSIEIKKDKRMANRKYYSATLKPIYEFYEQENIVFTEFEKFLLSNILESKAFKLIISNPILKKDFLDTEFNPAPLLFFNLELLSMTIEENEIIKSSIDIMKSKSKFIEMKKDSVDYINKIFNKYPERIELLQEKFDFDRELVNEFLGLLFIPESLRKKLLGVTQFGKMFILSKNIQRNISFDYKELAKYFSNNY